jgi:chromosome partitioning protein
MSAQRLNLELQLRYILPTMFDMRTHHSLDILRQLRRLFRKQICDPIRYNVRLSEAPARGKTIFEYRGSATGTIDYHKLVSKVDQDG